MRRFLLCLFAAISIATSYSQNTSVVFTNDIDNYWEAFDKITTTNNLSDKYKFIRELHIDKASKGLQLFMKKRNYTDSSYVQNIEKFPKFWNSIRNQTLEIKHRNDEIEKSIKRLKILYPKLKPAEIYFTIGGLRSGGTTDSNKVLIGTEIMVGTPETKMSEFKSDWLKNQFKTKKYIDIVYLTTHEYIHTQQKNGSTNLLGHAIREGSCDFIAELVLNKPIKTTYIEYGKANIEKVKKDFLSEMYSNRIDKWMYNGSNVETPDLGYFIGYEICKSFYKNSKNKKEAIKNIIELDYSNEKAIDDFLSKSKFYPQALDKQSIIATYEKNLPEIVKIEPFENGSTGVSTAIKKIKITFSKEMKDVSFGFSKNGKSHFPLLKKVGFESNNKTIVLETVDLKPKTKYDFYVNDNATESIDHYKFHVKEYKIEFETE